MEHTHTDFTSVPTMVLPRPFHRQLSQVNGMETAVVAVAASITAGGSFGTRPGALRLTCLLFYSVD